MRFRFVRKMVPKTTMNHRPFVNTFVKLIMLYCVMFCSSVHSELFTLLSSPRCPYVCGDESQAKGIIIELLKKIYGPDQVKVEILNRARAITLVTKGQADALLVSQSADATGFIYHQNPIMQSYQCFFSSADDNWQFTGISSLSGRHLAIVNGYFFDDILPESITSPKQGRASIHLTRIAGLDTTHRIINMLKAGRVDTFLEDLNVFNYSNNDILPDSINNIVEKGCLEAQPMFIAFSPAHKNRSIELASELDKGILTLHDNGELSQVIDKYIDWQRAANL